MCLFLTVRLALEDVNHAEQIAESCSGTGALAVSVNRTGFFKKVIQLQIAEVPGNCACDLLTDQADWNATVWDMRPEVLTGLATTLRRLRAVCRGDFQFEAVWAGDAIGASVAITSEKLARLIESGQVGNKISYLVTQG